MLRLLLLTLCVSIVGARDPNYYGATGRETAQRPNILFILADDLGFHDVGYHGSKVYTPYLDKVEDYVTVFFNQFRDKGGGG